MKQVTASLGASWQVVEILRPDGQTYRDIRPLVRVQRVGGGGLRRPQESGSYGYTAGREGYQVFLDGKTWSHASMRRCVWRSSTSNRFRRRRRNGCGARRGLARPSCCTKRSVTAWKATSTARRHRRLPA